MITRRTFSILRFVCNEFRAKMDPLRYARSIGVQLGENVHFYGMRSTAFSTEPWLIRIGNNVYITAGVQFITHDGGTLILRKEVPDLEYTAPIEIGNDVYIGLRSILPGTRIGNRCVIGGPGSVVTGVIPDNSVAAGVPARVIRSTDEYLEKLKQKSLHCGHLNSEEKMRFLKKHFGIGDV